MNDKIIERLLEVNEKRSQEADKKFYWTLIPLLFLLLITIAGNIYQATQTSEVVIGQENSVSNHNINGQFE